MFRCGHLQKRMNRLQHAFVLLSADDCALEAVEGGLTERQEASVPGSPTEGVSEVEEEGYEVEEAEGGAEEREGMVCVYPALRLLREFP